MDAHVPERHHLDRRADEVAERVADNADPDENLTESQAVVLTGYSAQWFQRGRWAGYGPPYVKVGRMVRYRRGDLVAWLRERVHKSTAEYETKGGRPRTVPRCHHCGNPLPRHMREAAQ